MGLVPQRARLEEVCDQKRALIWPCPDSDFRAPEMWEIHVCCLVTSLVFCNIAAWMGLRHKSNGELLHQNGNNFFLYVCFILTVFQKTGQVLIIRVRLGTSHTCTYWTSKTTRGKDIRTNWITCPTKVTKPARGRDGFSPRSTGPHSLEGEVSDTQNPL